MLDKLSICTSAMSYIDKPCFVRKQIAHDCVQYHIYSHKDLTPRTWSWKIAYLRTYCMPCQHCKGRTLRIFYLCKHCGERTCTDGDTVMQAIVQHRMTFQHYRPSQWSRQSLASAEKMTWSPIEVSRAQKSESTPWLRSGVKKKVLRYAPNTQNNGIMVLQSR